MEFWQLPLKHTCEAVQARPHMPQLTLLTFVFTQAPLQRICPPVHAHTPALQVPPVPHELPHMPQLAALVWRFTHCPLQRVCPIGHEQTPI